MMFFNLKAFLFLSIFSISSTYAQTCVEYFNSLKESKDFYTYSEYAQMRNQTSRAVVEVQDFKKNSWKFWVGSSAKKYYQPENYRTSTLLKGIYQEGRSHKIYLLIGEGKNESSTVIVEFNLFSKKSKVITRIYGELYSQEIYIPRNKNYIVLRGDSTSPGNYKGYVVSNKDSFVISLETGENFRIIHQSDVSGTTPWTRNRLKSYGVSTPKEHIQSLKIENREFYVGSIIWNKAVTHVMKIEAAMIQVFSLNLKTKKLDEVRKFNIQDLKTNDLEELKSLFGEIEVSFYSI